ncbi:hypothetical protein [Frateuria defendens]|uniref:hypothetical protein n=1 Tax=Frateuria defendens TaxID=2219559 RepID=UPI001293F644|nr:hypothetical protein [Frateuria defendens]
MKIRSLTTALMAALVANVKAQNAPAPQTEQPAAHRLDAVHVTATEGYATRTRYHTGKAALARSATARSRTPRPR